MTILLPLCHNNRMDLHRDEYILKCSFFVAQSNLPFLKTSQNIQNQFFYIIFTCKRREESSKTGVRCTPRDIHPVYGNPIKHEDVECMLDE